MEILFVCALLLPTCTTHGQIKRRIHYSQHIAEEFFAINHIRHGLYIKSAWEGQFKLVLEYGRFDKNQKFGQWLTFFPTFSNTIKSSGYYLNDLKQGLWTYYYPPADSILLGKIRIKGKAQLIEEKEWRGEKALVYDTSGMPPMASGFFYDDQKTGVWNYYSKAGKIIHRYDHSKNRFILNTYGNSEGLIFLGGEERFITLFRMAYAEESLRLEYNANAQAWIVIVPQNGNVNYSLEGGSPRLQTLMNRVLANIPSDWVPIDQTVLSPVIFKIDLKRNDYGFVSPMTISAVPPEKI